MPQMNNAQAMVVSPILSTLAHGYRNMANIGGRLFPRVTVAASSGKVIKFNRDRFKRIDTRRAPGAKVAEIGVSYGSEDYSCFKHDIDGVCPIELWNDANAVPGIDLGRTTVRTVQDALDTEEELERAAIARDVNNYPTANKEVLAGTTRWTQTTGTPLLDIADAREAIRTSIGAYPNTIAFSARAWRAAKFHADFIDRIKYSTGGTVTAQLVAALTEIPNVVVGSNQAVEQDETVFDVWGDDVILAYIPEGTDLNVGEPSYGYTYTVKGYPLVYAPYWDSSTRSWKYPFSDWRRPVLTGTAGGFLIKGAGTP